VVIFDGATAAVGVTCFLWVVVVVWWITCCGQYECAPMNCQSVESDFERACGRSTPVVVPILASRSVGSHRGMFVAIRLGEWVVVVQVNGFFLVVVVQIHDDDFVDESVH
jgi:hypothetical protein